MRESSSVVIDGAIRILLDVNFQESVCVVSTQRTDAAGAGTVTLGGDLTVNRMGFGAMRITGTGIWGEPADRPEAVRVLRRAVELGVEFIDTADSYGPKV